MTDKKQNCFQSDESETHWLEFDTQEVPFPTVTRGEVIKIVCGLLCLKSDVDSIQQKWNIDYSDGIREIDDLIQKIRFYLHPNEKEE